MKDPQRPLNVYMLDLWDLIPYYMARLCSSLRKKDARVTLGTVRYHLDRAFFQSQGLALDAILLDCGGKIRPKPLRRVVKALEYFINLTLVAFRMLFIRPDVLHIQFLLFLEVGLPLELWFMRWVRFLGVPTVYTVHNVTPQVSPKKHEELYRRVYSEADVLICHGEGARKELTAEFGVPEAKIWMIPHGPLFEKKTNFSRAEACKKLGLPENEVLVLSFGVISEYKGIPYLLDSWKRIQDQGMKARLIIAGTGDSALLSRIQNQVAQDRLDSVYLRLQFIPVEELPLLYQASDIFVYPYSAGSTSGALLTGLNYEKPIVATRLPYFLENLREGKTAVLVDYGDVAGLARSLAELITNPQTRSVYAANIREQLESSVNWEIIAQNTLDCYRSVLHRS